MILRIEQDQKQPPNGLFQHHVVSKNQGHGVPTRDAVLRTERLHQLSEPLLATADWEEPHAELHESITLHHYPSLSITMWIYVGKWECTTPNGQFLSIFHGGNDEKNSWISGLKPWLSMAFRQGQKPKVAGECCRDGQKSCPAFGRKVGRALPMSWRSMNWLLAEVFLQNHPRRSRRCRCHAVQVREWYFVFCYSSHRLIWCGVDALQLRTYLFDVIGVVGCSCAVHSNLEMLSFIASKSMKAWRQKRTHRLQQIHPMVRMLQRWMNLPRTSIAASPVRNT